MAHAFKSELQDSQEYREILSQKTKTKFIFTNENTTMKPIMCKIVHTNKILNCLEKFYINTYIYM